MFTEGKRFRSASRIVRIFRLYLCSAESRAPFSLMTSECVLRLRALNATDEQNSSLSTVNFHPHRSSE